MGDILRADAHCPPRAERVGSWRVLTESRGYLVAALPDGNRVAPPCRRDAEARGASMPKGSRFARTPRQLSAKSRRSDRAAASGVRKRDVLTGARSQGRSAVERVTEAVAGAGIMFRPFKSLGVVDFPGMRHHPIPLPRGVFPLPQSPRTTARVWGGGAGARGGGAWSARTRPSRGAATVGATRRLPLGWRAERCRGSMPVTVGAVAVRAAC